MKKILYVWKPVGITPLEAVQIFKRKNPEYRNETISYAGRLDPMAEGVLILLVGDENKKRSKYLDLDKEYESEIVLGISTDSFDALGIIESVDFLEIDKNEIVKQIKKFEGKQKQSYPPYSSKAVEGKPLYWWARNKKISDIDIPSHDIKIYTIELIGYENISAEELSDQIVKKVKNISGDFRQEEVIKGWDKFKKENSGKEMAKIKIIVSCSSGTYIRRIASDLGEELGVGAFAYSIKRVRVGDIEKKESLDLES